MTDEILSDEILETVPDDADVYEATLAFDRALGAAPNDRTLLRRWAARFPTFEDDFVTVGFSRYALGQALTDPLADYDADYDADYEAAPARPPLTGLASEAEARGLSVAAVAQTLRMDRTLLLRLDQRVLEAWTLPAALIDRLAQALERTTDEIRAYLSAPPKLASGTHYRARIAPKMVQERGILQSPVRQPSFADEVRRNSKMSDEDKAFWLAEVGE